jgi:hypothetical protein
MRAETSRLIALIGGGDWADASIEHLVIPVNLDIEVEKKKYREYLKEYRRLAQTPDRIPWRGFGVWLVENCSARPATENDIEIVSENLST